MAWCPKCKNEFREGISFCSDCKCELVNDYEIIRQMNATDAVLEIEDDKQEYGERFAGFLKSNQISSRTEKTENHTLKILVEPQNGKAARRFLKAFLLVEAEQMAMLKSAAGSEEEKENNEIPEDVFANQINELSDEMKAKNYAPELLQEKNPQGKKRNKSASDLYEDYKSSGYTFVVIGGALVVFAFLNLYHILSLFDTPFTLSVLFLLSFVFLVFGVVSFKKLPELKEEVEKEKEQMSASLRWLQEHVTKETISLFDFPMEAEKNPPEQTDEENRIAAEDLQYIARIEAIKNAVIKEFPDINVTLLERQIDTYYDETID